MLERRNSAWEAWTTTGTPLWSDVSSTADWRISSPFAVVGGASRLPCAPGGAEFDVLRCGGYLLVLIEDQTAGLYMDNLLGRIGGDAGGGDSGDSVLFHWHRRAGQVGALKVNHDLTLGGDDSRLLVVVEFAARDAVAAVALCAVQGDDHIMQSRAGATRVSAQRWRREW